MTKRKLTISDVATAAGVSTATVSRALNGGKVSVRVRARVEATVQRLGYRRNALARGLVTGRTGVVGVLIPDVVGPLYAQMARGVEDVLTPLGMHFMMATDNRDVAQERLTIGLLLERQVDALVLIGSQLSGDDLHRLTGGNTPVVLVQREVEDEGEDDAPTVTLDNQGGVRSALTYLLGRGHRVIAHLGGVRRDGEARERTFRETLREAGLREDLVFGSGSVEEGGVRAAEELLRHPEVTAAVCTNDRVALGLLHALKARGRRVPDDLSVVGFDDLPWAAYLDPPLTTVRQPGREMGRRAAESALAALRGERPPHVLVTPRFIERGSVRDLREEGGET